MGGQSSNESEQSQQTTPYGPAQGQLNSLLGKIGDLNAPPDRTGMVNDAYARYQGQMAPTAGGQYLDPNTNPFFAQTANKITSDTINGMAGLYAGSGRDPAGAGSFAGNVGGAVGTALAPMYGNAYNLERQNQLGAINSLYGAGGSTAGLLAGLDQIPLQDLAARFGMVLPAAQAFGKQTGTSKGVKEMSAAEEFALFSGAGGKMFGGGKPG
jgi:hypothetical protein